MSLLLLSAMAQAAPPKVVVLEGIGPLPTTVLSGLTDRARGAAQAAWPEALVMTRDTLEALLPPDVSLADCDDECEADAGRRVGADWVLTVRVAGVSAPHTVSVSLLSTAERAVLGQGEAKADDETLLDAVAVAVRRAVEMKNAQRPQQRALRIAEPLARSGPRVLRVTSPHALEVYVGDRRAGPAPIELPIGDEDHIALDVQSENRVPARLQVKLPPRSGQITITLPQSIGTLDLSALKTGELRSAQVEVDGMPVPQHYDVPLRAGRYQVRLRHDCASPRPVEVNIRGGERTRLPLAALMSCRAIELRSAYANSAVMIARRWRLLPQVVLVPPTGRSIRVEIAGQFQQTAEVPGDASSPYTLLVAPPRVEASIRGRFRDGSPCTAPLTIDAEPAGALPFKGDLTLGEHRLSTTCRLPIDRRINVKAPLNARLTEPFGTYELSVGLGENASIITPGFRYWLLDGPLFNIGLGLQMAYGIVDVRLGAVFELPIAIAGKYVDLLLVPGVSGTYVSGRAIARYRHGRMLFDLGWGAHFKVLDDADEDPPTRQGLFVGTGIIF